MSDITESMSMSYMIGAGCATVVLATALAVVLFKSKKVVNDDKISKINMQDSEKQNLILDKSKYPGGHLTVYFGSQTGTAESFAKDIEREGESKGFKVEVVDLETIEDDIQSALLDVQKRDDSGRNRAIFLMATYGEGEPTDNAVSFINYIKHEAGLSLNHSMDDDTAGEEKKREQYDSQYSDIFSGLDYAVFGLGNKQYEHFCAMGKLVDKSLSLTGAQRLLQLGIGDDDEDLEADFENWKDNMLWPALKKNYLMDGPVPTHSDNIVDDEKLPECHYTVEYLPQCPTEPDVIPIENVHMSSKHYFTAVPCPYTVKRELRDSSDGGSTLHIEIDISNAPAKLTYQTADNLGILPVNPDHVVQAIAKALNYDLKASFRLSSAPGHEAKHTALFPTPCTVYDCLSKYCDLTGPLRRSELKLLSQYAKDPMSKKALLRMASKDGRNEFKEKVMDAKIGIADIITKLCPSIEIPLEHFLSICPLLHPRYYTISSSSSVHPKSIHITVAILKEERKDKSMFLGVCSNHLAGLDKNGTIRVFTRDSTFRLPSDPSKPVIMIGPGTGIAPMRALLQEREYQKCVQKLDVGPNILYFGCKSKNQDFLYSEELSRFQNVGVLNKLHLAFSREQKEKVYVQHLLSQHSTEVWNLIDSQNAFIYVCGGVKMGQDVVETLRKIISENSTRSSDECKTYLDHMASEGRLVQELWS